ncbi:MAG: HAD family hydrolase [Actinomycetota bacterium]
MTDPVSNSFDALIVDFGGVLTSPLQDGFMRFATESGIELQDLVRAALKAYSGQTDSLVIGLETGTVSEDEFGREFARRLQEETGVAVDAEGIVDRLFSGMRIEQTMLEGLKLARSAGLKTAMLSNSWSLNHYPREILDPLFDVVIISGEVGLRKPDPEIYALTTSKLGVAPDRCVFVDDHPGHLEAAQEAGMATVLHRSPAQTLAELSDLLGTALT